MSSIEEGPARLSLVVSYLSFPDARDSGRIIETLAHSYVQWATSNSDRGFNLVLMRLEISSLRALFEVADSTSKIVDSYKHLKEYVENVALWITTLKDANLGTLPPSMRTFIAALIKPLVKKEARDVRLNVQGDNNVIVVIDHADSLILEAILRRPTPLRVQEDPFGPAPGEPLKQAAMHHADRLWLVASPSEGHADVPIRWRAERHALIQSLDPSRDYIVSGYYIFDGDAPISFQVEHASQMSRR